MQSDHNGAQWIPDDVCSFYFRAAHVCIDHRVIVNIVGAAFNRVSHIGHRLIFLATLCTQQLHVSSCEKVSSNWLKIEAELLRERAVFGPGPGVLMSRDWVQDVVEGPNRTRSRIRRKARRRSKRVQPDWKKTNDQSFFGLLCPTDGIKFFPPITTGSRNVVFKERHVRGSQTWQRR